MRLARLVIFHLLELDIWVLNFLCQEWARHTGRFREGIDEPDYVKWKTRLRCAFNKAPDFEEVKDESQLDGPDPYRVYLLKPRKSNNRFYDQQSL